MRYWLHRQPLPIGSTYIKNKWKAGKPRHACHNK
jgi:hypothetical protein